MYGSKYYVPTREQLAYILNGDAPSCQFLTVDRGVPAGLQWYESVKVAPWKSDRCMNFFFFPLR